MALPKTTDASEHSFSVSKLFLRLRTHRKKRKGSSTKQDLQSTGIETRPALIPAPIPLVLPEHQATLPALGWTTITFPEPTIIPDHITPASLTHITPHIDSVHPLQTAYEDLFVASQTFFDLPDSQKKLWKHKLASEEGWTKIPGEKEFITLRTLEYCPDVLKAPAKRYWDLMGANLSRTLGRISTSLGLPDDEDKGLRKFVGPCQTMQQFEKDKTATMLRLFRYEGWEPKVVAEPHADLGLLSVVVGNVPGLEVWDGHGWFEVEKEVERAGKKGASMLVGRQLERMSCGRFGAGGHRVVSYGNPAEASSTVGKQNGPTTKPIKYRFSIVFVLRAHEPVTINSDELETEITGAWAEPLRNVTAGRFYEKIRGAHYNINISLEEREKQRKHITESRGRAK